MYRPTNVIYYRGIEFEQEELAAAQARFTCTNRLPEIHKGDLVIGRYSLYPFYADQEKDIEYLGATLINSYQQHRYIADLQNYVYDLHDLTPKTWDNLQDIPEVGPFVIKGETNSRKSNWLRDMYAPDKKAAIDICNRLSNDGLMQQQKLYIRQYVPLVKLMDGVNGMPVTMEFRFFVAYQKLLCGGFYWQNYVDDLGSVPDFHQADLNLLNEVIRRVGNKSNFYVIDVAQTQSGEWIVIELNDGQQSGLSCVDPDELYRGLGWAVEGLI